MGQYDAIAQRALATITKKGGPVVFPGAIPGTPPVFNEGTGEWSGGTPPTDATGRAVQIDGDPDRWKTLSLVLINPVTLIIAAAGLAITPAPGMPFVWGGTTYTIKDPADVKPDGATVIIWTVTGSTG